MTNYSDELKASILAKMMPPNAKSVPQLSREEGIPTATLYTWRAKAQIDVPNMPKHNQKSDTWSAEKKFNTIIETAALNETELAQYCRERGLYPEQIKQWKQDSLQGFQSSAEAKKQERLQAKADKAEIKKLKRELRHKEKALAETAALLVLRKKLDALWEDENEES